MNTTRVDTVARLFDGTMTRRAVVQSLVAGTAAVAGGDVFVRVECASAGKKRHKKDRKRKDNVCKGLNWCVDRSQTCGPVGGYGKCLVEASGANICAEILFQVASCTECEAPNCANCRCVLAAGGGDRCNNGRTGYEFICVRAV